MSNFALMTRPVFIAHLQAMYDGTLLAIEAIEFTFDLDDNPDERIFVDLDFYHEYSRRIMTAIDNMKIKPNTLFDHRNIIANLDDYYNRNNPHGETIISH